MFNSLSGQAFSCECQVLAALPVYPFNYGRLPLGLWATVTWGKCHFCETDLPLQQLNLAMLHGGYVKSLSVVLAHTVIKKAAQPPWNLRDQLLNL
jgi:hypothetical protein